MRTLSVSTLVTLDGVIQDQGGFGETTRPAWTGPARPETGRVNPRRTAGTANLTSRRPPDIRTCREEEAFAGSAVRL